MNHIRLWKISDFVEELNTTLNQKKIHINTVDGWFKRLEKDRIHYINRTEDTKEKVYDELDFKIALFIKKKREEKWSLSGISSVLSETFELRPFPVKEEKSSLHIDNIEALKKEIATEAKRTFEELASTKIEELKKQYEALLHGLPKPLSEDKRKEQSFQALFIQRKIETELEKEALQAWSQLPEDQRLKRIGLFRKDTDWEKKEHFIRDYINDHFSERLKKEMELYK